MRNKYVVRDVEPSSYEDVSRVFKDQYYIARIKLGFDEYDLEKACRKSRLPKTLVIGDCEYQYRYSKKREAIAVSMKKNGVERIVLSDEDLLAEEKEVVRLLLIGIKKDIFILRRMDEMSNEFFPEESKNENLHYIRHLAREHRKDIKRRKRRY